LKLSSGIFKSSWMMLKYRKDSRKEAGTPAPLHGGRGSTLSTKQFAGMGGEGIGVFAGKRAEEEIFRP
jgi:hypothetical protein